jgi:hypothetical protein
MTPNPPLPFVKSLLVCREVVQDSASGDYVLVAPLCDVRTNQLPCTVQVGVYTEMTSGHGGYRPSLQLRDMEEQVVWAQDYAQPFEAKPLRLTCVAFRRVVLSFPRLGKYDLVLLVNAEEVARHPLWVSSLPQPAA